MLDTRLDHPVYEQDEAVNDGIRATTHPDVLPAGGSDPRRFDWTEVWYPIAYLDDLKRDQLTPFTLLDTNLVIWWDQPGQSWRVFKDQCPHRLAPLSEGRIAEDGLLECPYHGWAFTGTGACDRIPQQSQDSAAHQSARACAVSLPTAVRQGLLFVYPGTAERAEQVPIPTVDALDEPQEEWVCLNTFRDLPYDALTLLENVIDASHIPYTHHETVGKRENAAPMELQVLSADRQGFKGYWPEGPRRGKLGTQHTTFMAPNLMWHDLTSKQFGRTLTVVYATPIRKGECRLFARFPFKFPSKFPRLAMSLTPRWYTHIGQNGVLEDDQIFLHIQERMLEKAGGGSEFARAFYLPTQADEFVTQLRRWVTEFHAEPFPERDLSPTWSREALLDRYHSHTKHCQSCQGALKRVQRGKRWSAIAAGVMVAIVPVLITSFGSGAAWVSTIGTLVLGLVWLGLDRLERRFFEGRSVPPRNQKT